MLGGMTELAERGHHVRFGFPVLGLQLFRKVLIERGRTCAVKEHEDFEFFLHVVFVVFVMSSETACPPWWEESLLFTVRQR